MRVGRAMFLALGAGLVLGACTPSEEEPSPTAEPSSETVSPTDEVTEEPTEERPEVEAPERPAEMDEETVDGAIAAATYFMRLYPYIFQSGDFTDWDELSGDDCDFCSTARRHATDLHAEGGYSTGGEVEIGSRDGGGPYDDPVAANVYIVEIEVTAAPAEHVRGDGSRDDVPAENFSDLRFSLVWRDGWRVLGAWQAGSDS